MDTLVLLQRGELREALVTLIAKDNKKGRVRGQCKCFSSSREELSRAEFGSVFPQYNDNNFMRHQIIDLPGIGPVVAMGSHMFTQGLLADEHALTLVLLALEKH